MTRCCVRCRAMACYVRRYARPEDRLARNLRVDHSSRSNRERHVHAAGCPWEPRAPCGRPLRGLRRAARRVLLIGAALTAGLAVTAAPAHAAQAGVTQVSADPYTPAVAPSGERATEVEPDTFAHGSTLVTAFPVGRVFNGGGPRIRLSPRTHGGGPGGHRIPPGPRMATQRPRR